MPFLSIEPQSRVVLASHSDRLLAQFDAHLQIIADRYLAFFQERRQIEATYINSLRKLNRKAKIIDASPKTRAEPTNTRAAWDTVRDSLVKEANTKQAFVDILDKDVIKPLTTLKWELVVETRKRMEEDLTKSAAGYSHFVENTISRLQQAYLKKYHPWQCSHSTQDAPNNRLGGKESAASRRQQGVILETELARSEDVSDENLREAVIHLNDCRLIWAEILRDGYDCLEGLVFTPTVNDVLVKYMNGMIATCGKYYGLVLNTTKATIEKALAGTDASDLKASFRRAHFFAIPPITLYRNYNRPAPYSELIFGAPLAVLETNEDNVPKVMRMCIEEVEKRGLNTTKIYSMGTPHDADVLQLRRRLESEKSFSFSSTDNIHCIAMLLKHYLWKLPEPLFMLSLQDYRTYGQDRARYTENDFLLLRSKIRAKHSVHRASLRTLLRHLFRVASHSDKNKMTVDALAAKFSGAVSRRSKHLKDSGPPYVKELVLKDLIQHVHTLFDERPPLSPSIPSPDLSDTALESRLTPSPTPLLSPLPGLPSSHTLKDGVETTTGEKVIPKAREIKAVETLSNSILAPPEVSPQAAPSPVAEWRLQVPSRLPPQPEAPTIPQTPTGSVPSSLSDFPLSSATSLQTRMG